MQHLEQFIYQAFPSYIKPDIEIIAQFLFEHDFTSHSDTFSVKLHNQTLKIPYRIYGTIEFTEISQNLTSQQKSILYCLLTRHHDGFIRQHALILLIKNMTDDWIIPYVFKLFGEYVIEILYVAIRHITPQTANMYKKFMIDNPNFCRLTECRMISYWNEYYRHYKLHQYIGKEIFNKLSLKSYN